MDTKTAFAWRKVSETGKFCWEVITWTVDAAGHVTDERIVSNGYGPWTACMAAYKAARSLLSVTPEAA